jgi:hypothetical protein
MIPVRRNIHELSTYEPSFHSTLNGDGEFVPNIRSTTLSGAYPSSTDRYVSHVHHLANKKRFVSYSSGARSGGKESLGGSYIHVSSGERHRRSLSVS